MQLADPSLKSSLYWMLKASMLTWCSRCAGSWWLKDFIDRTKQSSRNRTRIDVEIVVTRAQELERSGRSKSFKTLQWCDGLGEKVTACGSVFGYIITRSPEPGHPPLARRCDSETSWATISSRHMLWRCMVGPGSIDPLATLHWSKPWKRKVRLHEQWIVPDITCAPSACQTSTQNFPSATSRSVISLAISSLEDDPLLNAGLGSNLTFEGHVECDAAIMESENEAFGSVAAVSGLFWLSQTHFCLTKYCFVSQGIKNPIQVAQRLLEKSQEPSANGLIPPMCATSNNRLIRRWSDNPWLGLSPRLALWRLQLRMRYPLYRLSYWSPNDLSVNGGCGDQESRRAKSFDLLLPLTR